MIFHRWRYRNPYERTCIVCGKREVVECWVKGWESDIWYGDEWEEYTPAKPDCHWWQKLITRIKRWQRAK